MRRLLPLAALVAALALPAPASADPSIGYSCSPEPSSCKVWYRQPVTIHWTVTGLVLAGCDDTTIDFDTMGVAIPCSARADGVDDSKAVTLKVDQTAPLVTGVTPSRPPDHDGWYRSPVQVTFTGKDATSGLLGCSSASYSGPNAAAVNLLGRCQDNAGNVSGPTAFGLRYDSAPPTVTGVTASESDHTVRLRWTIPDGTAVDVWRTREGGRRHHLLSGGPSGSVVDRHLRNGRRYTYDVTATDAAGNVATRTLTAVPGPRLLLPASGALVPGAPLLRWTPVHGARYYNVQVFRGRRKVLSAWPKAARLQLDRTWRFGGERRRLVDGRKYRWFVWPGRGPRLRNDYGPLIGTRTFTLRAP
jgi:hypothetical protein